MFVVFACTVAPKTNAAQKGKPANGPKNDERRENEAVRKAKQDLEESQKARNSAERSLRQSQDQAKDAERNLLQAISHLQKTREELERKHAEAAGLFSARKDAASARQAYEAAGQPVLLRLRESAEYRAAVKAATAAEQQLSSQPNDPEGNADQRLKQRVAAATIMRVPAQLERTALDAEPGLKVERTRLSAAEEAVASARKQVDRAIAKDPALKAASDKVEQARAADEAARRAFLQAQRQLEDARKKYASEQQDLLRKIAADKRDDNKPNKGKKK